MRFTLAQLEAFVRIVDVGTFHAAARQLSITQPTISQRIRDLEGALGVALFVRSGPRVQLTAEGEALVDDARRIVGMTGDLGRRFSGREALAGVVRLGVPNMFGILCMTDLLRRLDQSFPNLKASVRMNDSITLQQMLEGRELDIAILNEPTVSANIRQIPVGRTEHAWLASSAFLGPDVIRPADLASVHVIVSPPPSRLYTLVSTWFSAAGVTPARLSTCNNFSVTLEAIASGLAVGALPIRALQLAGTRGRLKPLAADPPLPANRMSLCYQDDVFGAGLDVIVALMRELIREYSVFED